MLYSDNIQRQLWRVSFRFIVLCSSVLMYQYSLGWDNIFARIIYSILYDSHGVYRLRWSTCRNVNLVIILVMIDKGMGYTAFMKYGQRQC